MSFRASDGTEYLWQGDPAYWPDHAPALFPFIGRLTENRCRRYGEEYPMGIHGFAAHSRFSASQKSDGHIVLEQASNEETRNQYPFAFLLQVIYRLEKAGLRVSYTVENQSERMMPFAIGGHPGFRVPLEENESFTDYDWSSPAVADRIEWDLPLRCILAATTNPTL